MDADPDHAVFIPGAVVEQHMVDRRIVRPILPPNAEAHGAGDIVCESAQCALDRIWIVAELVQR
jgi:hypothetical protein